MAICAGYNAWRGKNIRGSVVEIISSKLTRGDDIQ